MHQEPRNGASIDRIYLHTNEGPQVENGAQGLVNYLHTIDAGYHCVVDDWHTISAAADDVIVWGAGGDNTHSLHVCMIGRAAQDWNTPYSKAETERAAQKVADWVQAYDVPVVHVRPGAPGKAPTDHGIAKHADNHDPRSGGHTDPGDGFPIDAFVKRVAKIIADREALVKLLKFYDHVLHHPLHEGDKNEYVVQLKGLLDAIGEGVKNKYPTYGSHLVTAVHDFKVKHHHPNDDGRVFGGPACLLLFSLLK